MRVWPAAVIFLTFIWLKFFQLHQTGNCGDGRRHLQRLDGVGIVNFRLWRTPIRLTGASGSR